MIKFTTKEEEKIIIKPKEFSFTYQNEEFINSILEHRPVNFITDNCHLSFPFILHNVYNYGEQTKGIIFYDMNWVLINNSEIVLIYKTTIAIYLKDGSYHRAFWKEIQEGVGEAGPTGPYKNKLFCDDKPFSFYRICSK